ncbi:MAG: hypothetical protein ACUBOA_00980 [Candidatus Loosdrechtia sp.]|uniref:hypothetical protein n=1 Tax=Candidatus Loosdrechtia sp. TaxID=3101272 RepID=UPI003A73B93C|nr:MAG: hypothetical protein QY305_07820 [Candidatus Jettenia sp. AMX2]
MIYDFHDGILTIKTKSETQLIPVNNVSIEYLMESKYKMIDNYLKNPEVTKEGYLRFRNVLDELEKEIERRESE